METIVKVASLLVNTMGLVFKVIDLVSKLKEKHKKTNRTSTK